MAQDYPCLHREGWRMEIWFTRLDPKTHRFLVRRPPHAPVDARLETRSLLLHDFAHYAVETTLATEAGFYGRLAAGMTLAELRALDDAGALMELEGNVARLQSSFRRGTAGAHPAFGVLRGLDGAWRKARQGEALRLTWPGTQPQLVPAPD